jgi:hypothetical protein
MHNEGLTKEIVAQRIVSTRNQATLKKVRAFGTG